MRFQFDCWKFGFWVWLWIFGRVFSIGYDKDYEPLFSERYGYAKSCRFMGFIFKFRMGIVIVPER